MPPCLSFPTRNFISCKDSCVPPPKSSEEYQCPPTILFKSKQFASWINLKFDIYHYFHELIWFIKYSLITCNIYMLQYNLFGFINFHEINQLGLILNGDGATYRWTFLSIICKIIYFNPLKYNDLILLKFQINKVFLKRILPLMIQ